MHYAQAGKTHREAFHDNDQDIHDENITGIRYLSGEFDVNLNCGPDGVHEEDLQDWADFIEWCKSKGLDTTDPTLALGWAPLADMDKSKFQNLTDFEIMKELYYYDDLFKMELYKLEHDSEVLVGERSWDYTWRDLYER